MILKLVVCTLLIIMMLSVVLPGLFHLRELRLSKRQERGKVVMTLSKLCATIGWCLAHRNNVWIEMPFRLQKIALLSVSLAL